MADQIGLHIGVRILDRIPHPGLRTQMHDPFEYLALQSGCQRRVICEIDLLEYEAGAFQLRQAVFL